eukprot:7581565-Pyramimonas_sp.AAC.1
MMNRRSASGMPGLVPTRGETTLVLPRTWNQLHSITSTTASKRCLFSSASKAPGLATRAWQSGSRHFGTSKSVNVCSESPHCSGPFWRRTRE